MGDGMGKGMERCKKEKRRGIEWNYERGLHISHTNFNDHSFNEKDFFTGVIYDLKVARS